jgi:hypothetical protein
LPLKALVAVLRTFFFTDTVVEPREPFAANNSHQLFFSLS